MKRINILLIAVLVAMTSYAQTPTNIDSLTTTDKNAVYKLFPTKNMWTFIKLNTRTGQMWQVQYTVEDSKYRFETYLSLMPLVPEEKEMNGRFTLYPTQNTYNFILLDQIDGQTWQVQWNIDAEDRFIVPIE